MFFWVILIKYKIKGSTNHIYNAFMQGLHKDSLTFYISLCKFLLSTQNTGNKIFCVEAQTCREKWQMVVNLCEAPA